MFGQQFFPTPKQTILRMIEGLDLRGRRVLDPSAGRGDILDTIKSFCGYGKYPYSHWRNQQLYAIEIDTNLRAVLREKDYKVIDSDFLNYNGHQFFHYIIMNPPFEDGAKHLLKAWEVSQGAVIKCLLNAETVRNPYTQDRKQLRRIIAQYGSIEELGRPFMEADNPTPVEVVLISLQDTRQVEDFRLEFDPATMGGETYELDDIQPNELASANIFENYEARHQAAIEAFKELLQAQQKVSYYLKGLLYNGATGKDIMAEAVKKDSTTLAYLDFVEVTTKKAWDSIFYKTKLGALTTGSVRAEIEKLQADQGVMVFTAKNMEDLFYQLALNKEKIMVDCVLEAFDSLTKHYPENRIGVEGWKTNSSYRVDKFILPNIGKGDDGWSAGLNWRARDKLGDLEKALCFLSGKKFENILHIWDMYDRENHFGEWMTSEFFETKLFKKGTMHFKWLDKNLRDDFNVMVAQHRWGQVPEKTKAGVYR